VLTRPAHHLECVAARAASLTLTAVDLEEVDGNVRQILRIHGIEVRSRRCHLA